FASRLLDVQSCRTNTGGMDRERQVSGQRSRWRSVSVQGELAERIGQGQLAAGTRLPSEPELAAEFGVSRATLREALRALEGQGFVRRLWGSGTYVADRTRVANSLDLNFGVSDAIRAAGMQAGTEQGRHRIGPASASAADRTVARLLGTRTGDLLLYLWQVDYADGGAAVLSSHEYHLADAFDFSVVRRGPGRRFS